MTAASHDVVVATYDRAAPLHDLGDQQRFITRLTEAIALCTSAGSLSDPKASLRTCKATDLVLPEDQVDRVCISRTFRLPELGRRLPPVTDLCAGRLVAYFPSFNLADGWAQTQSEGFLDVDNIPPYDTWVWWVRSVNRVEYADHRTNEIEASYLVAWVPPDFVELATAGIEANPESCIRWLDELDDDFVRSLRSMKFLPDAPVGVAAPSI